MVPSAYTKLPAYWRMIASSENDDYHLAVQAGLG